MDPPDNLDGGQRATIIAEHRAPVRGTQGQEYGQR
jgi:hypothetical protein